MKASYTEYDIGQALHAITKGKSVRTASSEWGPRATLYNRMHGHECRKDAGRPAYRMDSHPGRHGPPSYALADQAVRAAHARRQRRPLTARKPLDASFFETQSCVPDTEVPVQRFGACQWRVYRGNLALVRLVSSFLRSTPSSLSTSTTWMKQAPWKGSERMG